MLNLFNKTPTVTIWSSIKGIEDIAPPVPAKDVIPEWFKKMPLDIMHEFSGHPGTVKRCPGLVDYLSQGYVLKMWCDLYIKINKDRTFDIRTPEQVFGFTNHLDNQFLDHIPDRETFSMVLKGNNPWRMMTPKGWSMMQLPLYYNFNKDFTVLPGVIWTDIHHEVNPQIAFYGYGEYLIKRGTPLAVYIPYKREKVSYKISKITNKLKDLEEKSYYWFASKFRGGYKEHQNKIKKDKS